jgi:hypothetical protein
VLERIWNHIIAFVVIVLLIAAAPVITLAAAVWMASVSRIDPDEIILSVMVGPVLVAVWYMFVASVTRLAWAKREGVSPRTGFLCAGGRLFGGWFLSFGSAILALLGVDRVVGAFAISSPSRIVFPVLFLGVWSPVIVNLLRHIMRYFTPRSRITSPVGGAADDQARMLGRRGGRLIGDADGYPLGGNLMDDANIYVLTSLSIDAIGNVISRNVGVTFNIHEAEEHKAGCVEHDFETFQIDANWHEDAATSELVIAMRGFRDMVREWQEEALR